MTVIAALLYLSFGKFFHIFQRPGIEIKKLALLSIFPTPDDYRVSDPARKVAPLVSRGGVKVDHWGGAKGDQ